MKTSTQVLLFYSESVYFPVWSISRSILKRVFSIIYSYCNLSTFFLYSCKRADSDDCESIEKAFTEAVLTLFTERRLDKPSKSNIYSCARPVLLSLSKILREDAVSSGYLKIKERETAEESRGGVAIKEPILIVSVCTSGVTGTSAFF